MTTTTDPIMYLVIVTVIKTTLFLMVFVMGVTAMLTWLERKYSALIQNRIGPARANVGKWRLGGLFHLIADAGKMFLKEDFVPNTANPILFRLAPAMALIPALLVFAAIPFGPDFALADKTVFWVPFGRDVALANGTLLPMQIGATSLGILFIFAIASLNVYGAVLGAWASNNKWSLMGGLRISAQMISYEVALGLTLVGVFMIYGSVDIQQIIVAQGDLGWGILYQPVAFVLYLTCAIAENKRAPFDVAEAESELTAGYWTEYSAMSFGMFAMSEFVEVVLIGCIGATLFLGGWHIPGLDGSWLATHIILAEDAVRQFLGWALVNEQIVLIQGVETLVKVPASSAGLVLLQVGAFLTKALFLVWLQMTIRWTLPRFRYDQIMRLGWRMLLPAALLNLLVTGVVLAIVDRF